MEGFTVSNAQRFVNSGQTNSIETKTQRFPYETPGVAEGDALNGKSFASTLNEAINQVDKLQKNADVKMQELATGKTDNIADVMIAADKADIALKLMVQVRGKIIEAYQEVMRMQV